MKSRQEVGRRAHHLRRARADRARRAARTRSRCSPGAVEQRQADGRGEEPPRRRRQLPGAGRSAPGAPQSRWRCAGCARRRASAARSRWAQRLADELLDAVDRPRRRGRRRRDEVHRMAEANKAFSHFRSKPRFERRASRAPGRTPARSAPDGLARRRQVEREGPCPARLPSSATATSASSPTSTPARPRRPSASFSTPASSTRSARCTTAPP